MARRGSTASGMEESWHNLTPVWLPMDLPLPLSGSSVRRWSIAEACSPDPKDAGALHSVGEFTESFCFGEQGAGTVTWNAATISSDSGALALGLCLDEPAMDNNDVEGDESPRPVLPLCYNCNFVLKRSASPCGQRFAHILEFLTHLRFSHWHTHWRMSDAELVRGGVPLEYCSELRRMIDFALGHCSVEFGPGDDSHHH
ncbi:hypothetical protein AURDEDRAFT_111713 [Auricularia subglabra TFB-10046 SS5]|nr:hypothetical protein AURDEDRAFT_111713 [Auricularia subglabra TFB-10046 SS5]